jgi:hypothetical protein
MWRCAGMSVVAGIMSLLAVSTGAVVEQQYYGVTYDSYMNFTTKLYNYALEKIHLGKKYSKIYARFLHQVLIQTLRRFFSLVKIS